MRALSNKNGHGNCLFCGDQNPLSFRLRFRADPGATVSAKFQASQHLQGYDGFLHGGIISALLDAAMTHCLFHQQIQAMTGDLHVRFLHPIPCDSVLVINARILSQKPPLYVLRAELTCDGQVMAWAQAKFMRRGAP